MDIKIRALSVQDSKFMYQVENDPDVWQYSTLGAAPYTLEQIEEYCLNHNELPFLSVTTDYRWVVECDGVAVGFLDLYDIEFGVAGVGMIIYNSQYRGIGVGQMALELMVLECRGVGIHSLCATVMRDNTSALRFFETCAFQSSDSVDSGGQVTLLRVLF